MLCHSPYRSPDAPRVSGVGPKRMVTSGSPSREAARKGNATSERMQSP